MPILDDIETFLKAKGMSPTTFGYKALNDPNLVFRMREGRELLPRTERKVREFMLTYSEAA
jgi:hypothetical protein